MIAWLCDKCGCELAQKEKPEQCPLCMRSRDFTEFERKDPDKEDLEVLKKYEEVIEQLKKYSENCKPEENKSSCAGED